MAPSLVSLTQSRRIDVLADHLSFAIDDYEAAGEMFARWRDSGHDADLDQVLVWAYCYTHRYFYIQFARERTGGVSDVDAEISRAFDRVLKRLHTVREPLKFASFVSVICKRTLLNHRLRRHETVEVEEHMAPTVPAPTPGDYDQRLIRQMLAAAIEALPESIRDIARMRLLERMGYEAIADVTGRPTPTVRAYVSKAVTRLRQNDDLRALYSDAPLPGLDDDLDVEDPDK